MKLHPRLFGMVIGSFLFVGSTVEATPKQPRSCTKTSVDNRRNQQRWFWHLGLAGVLGMCGTAAASEMADAQLRPDGTLGAESSRVQPINQQVDRIDGGAKRGTNLFHSFLEFNVDAGRGVYFANPAGIENILTRVTGGNPSNILGRLGVLGNANLFLLNPNGIIFGLNASLSVNGSFVATTANAIRLANGDVFGANPRVAPPSQILNAHPEALLFNQIAAQPTNSIAVNGADLEVPLGQSLLLVGGNVSPTATATGSVAIDGATISAPGGRVEIGGVGTNGTVGLRSNGSILFLSFPDSLERTDVSLTNGAQVFVRAASGGSITINARNFDMAGGSNLLAGIDSGMGTPQSQAGDVEVNATGAVNLRDGSSIFNDVLGVGNGGNIYINSSSLSGTDGAEVAGGTFGQGNAGNVTITARDTVAFDGVGNGYSSGAFSQVASTGVGNGGDVNITTGSLSLTNGAYVGASTYGKGNAGNVTITARDTVAFDGGGSDGNPSGAGSQVASTGVGNGGDVKITTGSLSLTNGAQVSTATLGQGNAGNVIINARDTVAFDGVNQNGSTSGAFSAVESTRVSKGGDITINTTNLNLTNGAVIDAESQGTGNAGNININARQNIRASQGTISTKSTQAGGGNITINANDIRLRNDSPILSSVQNSDSSGNGGNITINSKIFITLEDSDILANAVRGNGGNITINSAAFLADLFSSGKAVAVGRNPGNFAQFRGNGRVDISAASEVGISGNANIPDFTFLQNSLSALPANLLDTNKLLANAA